ncbi:MAG: hypothetical protein H6713_12820 [Myxococcales bacterium]|nr:hypothetical protein [Myxococcales bacterium]MCB9750862.1 hypothetical protein [Myxococcales bacterium]
MAAATLLGACGDSSSGSGETTESGTAATEASAGTDGGSDSSAASAGSEGSQTDSGTGDSGDTSDTGEPDEPHAQGTIILGESHPAGGGSSVPFVAASFVPNVEGGGAGGCWETVQGCKIALTPDCGDGCNADEYCAFDDSCGSTCARLCDASCGADEVCYFPAPDSPACKKIEPFDAGALTFLGTPIPINLFPPYAFSGDSGTPFSPGGAGSVQASGATAAGFASFEVAFTGTQFIQTSPSLDKLGIGDVFGDGPLPVRWQAGDGEVEITVSVTGDDFSSGQVTCEADDASGSFDVPRAALLAAVDGAGLSGVSVSIRRARTDRTKHLMTKGELTGVTVEPEGWVDVVTISTESHTFMGCQPGESFCGDSCIDTQWDDDNCGGCGESCPNGDSCNDGACNGVDSCNACAEDSATGDCKAVNDACAADPQCAALDACLIPCQTQDCVQECANMYSDGIDLYNETVYCICEDACVLECAGLCS